MAAVRKNGLPKITGKFFEYKRNALLTRSNQWGRGEIVAACAIGQACFNLQLDPNTLVGSDRFIREIIRLNDETTMTLAEIADWVETQDWYNPADVLQFSKEE